MSSDYSVVLYRDSLSTAWGFRLEGGADLRMPLSIMRVFHGSPASADLQRGDIITAIQHTAADHLSHQQANELIRSTGGSLHLNIRRNNTFLPMSHAAPVNLPAASYLAPKHKVFNANSDFTVGPLPSYSNLAKSYDSSYIRNRGIEKTSDPRPILSQTGSPMLPGLNASLGMRTTTTRRYRPASTAPLFDRSPAPHHDSRMVSQLQQSLSGLSRNAYTPQPAYASAYPGSYEEPSYNGYGQNSYSQSYAPQPQQFFAPAQPIYSSPRQQPQPQPQYHSGSSNGGYQSTPKSPKVQLTYNTPIGLYSKENVKKELFNKLGPAQDFEFAAASEF